MSLKVATVKVVGFLLYQSPWQPLLVGRWTTCLVLGDVPTQHACAGMHLRDHNEPVDDASLHKYNIHRHIIDIYTGTGDFLVILPQLMVTIKGVILCVYASYIILLLDTHVYNIPQQQAGRRCKLSIDQVYI